MFDFAEGHLPVPHDLSRLFSQTFEDIASPGDAWKGAERIALAGVARTEATPSAVSLLPDVAVQAATTIARHPSGSQEPTVRKIVSDIGETRYVELVGIISAVAAIDSITTLLGFGIEALPAPQAGEPVPAPASPKLKQRSAWVAMDGPAAPRHALSAAPKAQAMVTRLIDRLYMPVEDLGGVSSVRGLSREQMEIVILKISHTNGCYW